jgi:hypothetical protein
MLLSDLDELEDILDSLVPEGEEEEPFYFNEDEECDIIENVMQLMNEYQLHFLLNLLRVFYPFMLPHFLLQESNKHGCHHQSQSALVQANQLQHRSALHLQVLVLLL